MPRKVPEWVGKTDDTRPPPTVLLRIYQKTEGCCYICSQRLRAGRWDADHKVPLWDGGENRESNLWPACDVCHTDKTSEEASQRAEARRHQKKAAGIKPRKQKIPYRRFNGEPVWPD